MSTKSPVLIIKERRYYSAGAECSVPFIHSVFPSHALTLTTHAVFVLLV